MIRYQVTVICDGHRCIEEGRDCKEEGPATITMHNSHHCRMWKVPEGWSLVGGDWNL